MSNKPIPNHYIENEINAKLHDMVEEVSEACYNDHNLPISDPIDRARVVILLKRMQEHVKDLINDMK